MLRQEEIKRIVDAARGVLSEREPTRTPAEAELKDALDSADRVTALRRPASHGVRTLTDSPDVPAALPG